MITQVTDNERAQAATIEALRQEVTAWSVTAENLEAERDALKSRIEADMQSWYKLHYLMKKRGWHPGRTDDDLIDVLDGKLEELREKLAALETLYLNSLADATQWQLYKSRKDAVIAAGMGRKAMRDSAAGAAPVQQVFSGRVDPSYVSGPMEEASAAKVPEEQTP